MRADRTVTDRLGRLGLSMEGATADGGQQPEPQEGSSSSDSKLRELPFKAGTGEPGELSVNTVAALEEGVDYAPGIRRWRSPAVVFAAREGAHGQWGDVEFSSDGGSSSGSERGGGRDGD